MKRLAAVAATFLATFALFCLLGCSSNNTPPPSSKLIRVRIVCTYVQKYSGRDDWTTIIERLDSGQRFLWVGCWGYEGDECNMLQPNPNGF